MILHDVWNLELGFLPEKPIEIEPVQEYLSTDTGLLLFRQFDEQLGFTEDFAAQLNDVRSDPTHSILEMVRSRVFGILAGYEDQNDHDALRRDAIFKIIANRLPDDEDLASQPTLSRFENAVTPGDLLRLEDWFIQRFVDSFDEPPKQITLDIDVFDDPTHGAQQLTLFHGYYKQYEIPTEACTGRTRRGQFNRRRRADPLGEGHACTWRTMLIKVAARIKITARRVRVFLSGSWPFLHFFRDVARDLANDT